MNYFSRTERPKYVNELISSFGLRNVKVDDEKKIVTISRKGALDSPKCQGIFTCIDNIEYYNFPWFVE